MGELSLHESEARRILPSQTQWPPRVVGGKRRVEMPADSMIFSRRKRRSASLTGTVSRSVIRQKSPASSVLVVVAFGVIQERRLGEAWR